MTLAGKESRLRDVWRAWLCAMWLVLWKQKVNRQQVCSKPHTQPQVHCVQREWPSALCRLLVPAWVARSWLRRKEKSKRRQSVFFCFGLFDSMLFYFTVQHVVLFCGALVTFLHACQTKHKQPRPTTAESHRLHVL